MRDKIAATTVIRVPKKQSEKKVIEPSTQKHLFPAKSAIFLMDGWHSASPRNVLSEWRWVGGSSARTDGDAP